MVEKKTRPTYNAGSVDRAWYLGQQRCDAYKLFQNPLENSHTNFFYLFQSFGFKAFVRVFERVLQYWRVVEWLLDLEVRGIHF